MRLIALVARVEARGSAGVTWKDLYEYLTNPRVAGGLQVTDPTARMDLRRLEKHPEVVPHGPPRKVSKRAFYPRATAASAGDRVVDDLATLVEDEPDAPTDDAEERGDLGLLQRIMTSEADLEKVLKRIASETASGGLRKNTIRRRRALKMVCRALYLRTGVETFYRDAFVHWMAFMDKGDGDVAAAIVGCLKTGWLRQVAEGQYALEQELDELRTARETALKNAPAAATAASRSARA